MTIEIKRTESQAKTERGQSCPRVPRLRVCLEPHHLSFIRHFILALVFFCLLARASAQTITIVPKPETTQTNSFYVSNRAPLEPDRLIALPVGSVQPQGWLLEMLKRQRDGLCGHLGEISVWLEKDDNAWLSQNGKGKHGWEEVPYWLRGYIQLAYIFNDPKMIAEAESWIHGVLNSQRPDGDFGPDQKFDDDGSRDYWANMLMMYCLETYYEHSRDPRVLDLLTKYFKYQLTVPDNKFLTHYWQKMRGGDNLYSVYWLYNRTGDPMLLQLADKIHRCTANWELKDDLPNWHNVNIAESFREPAEHFLQTHNEAELQDTYADFHEVRKRYGQVPGGMFGSDENCRPGYSDPRQGIETCGLVEQMFSDELLTAIDADPFWADNCENVAFNMLPAALTPDMRALRYLTAPNMVISDSKNHSPGIDNGGPFLMMNPFSSRCCQHNHSMGWPYFNKHLWFATPDNGLCAALYSADEVTAQVADGTQVHFTEDTHYPFDEAIRFTFHADKSVTFPLYLRIPGWCDSATVAINGKKPSTAPNISSDSRESGTAISSDAATVSPSLGGEGRGEGGLNSNSSSAAYAGKYIRITRQWKDGDSIVLNLPMKISVHRWQANQDSLSVNYGPLTFSLKIGEDFVQQDSTRTAIGDSGWQKSADPSKWPAFEIYPTTQWNYGLVLNDENPEKSFRIKKLAWPTDNYPFTPESSPIEIQAQARLIPQWTLDKYELCSVLQPSPAWSDQPTTKVTLIPMGATRLRISAFPETTANPADHHWQ